MGGLLFNTQRLPIKEFNEYRSHVESILDFHGIEYKIPLYYRSKRDFGDLDVLIKTTIPNKKLLDIFRNCDNHYDNIDGNISFNYKDFQIDFIKIKSIDFEIAFHYYSWNDLGNLIGQLAKYNHLKFGFNGLRYDHYDSKKQKKGSVFISKNIDKILSFLDLNPVKFHQGFDTIEEVFDFIVKSKYFNPYVSDLEPYGYNDDGVAQYYINKVNRERNYKRKTYLDWLKHINPLKTGKENFKFKSDEDLDEIFDKIDEFFPESNLKEKIYDMNKEDNYKKMIKLKFNGNIIKNLLPDIKRDKIQIFINSFKSEHVNFTDYILNTDQDRINRDIINFYNIFDK